mgnify:CR=1 FL=1
MKLSHRILFFINSFSVGLMAPVLSLVLLAHGATLGTLSLCVGTYAIMVVVLEVPSGVLADFFGRKRVFLLSCLFLIVNYFLITISKNVMVLAAACAFQGMGRALSSGTIEALEIETYMKEQGEDKLAAINSELAILDSIGLALGSLCGGYLGYLNPTYKLLLMICIIVQSFIFALAFSFIKEERPEGENTSFILRLKTHMQTILIRLRHSRIVMIIFMMSFLLGYGLCAIEVYWQPTLMEYLPGHFNWILGVINCLGYLGSSIGNKLAEFMWRYFQCKGSGKMFLVCYWTSRILLPFTIISLGLCRNMWMFTATYALIYMILGISNLFENTIFHASIENGQRASMMSMSSLFLRGGGVASSVLSSIILLKLSLLWVWIFIPISMLGGILLLMALNK